MHGGLLETILGGEGLNQVAFMKILI